MEKKEKVGQLKLKILSVVAQILPTVTIYFTLKIFCSISIFVIITGNMCRTIFCVSVSKGLAASKAPKLMKIMLLLLDQKRK